MAIKSLTELVENIDYLATKALGPAIELYVNEDDEASLEKLETELLTVALNHVEDEMIEMPHP